MGKRFGMLGLVVLASACGGDGGGGGPCPEKVLDGQYTVNPDQNAVSDLEGYTRITGSLQISNRADTDLEPLRCLRQVDGSLHIGAMEQLTTLEGLRSLTTVGENFGVYHCYALTGLGGLEQLSSIGGYIDMSFNSSLPLCEVEAFVQRMRDNGFTGNAETSYNDETATCD